MKPILFSMALSLAAASAFAQDKVLEFTATPTVLVRSPDPVKLAQFYEAIGFKKDRTSPNGTVYFYLEGDTGSLEVLNMDPGAKPAGGKTSRTQQGVVAIFEVNDQEEVARRAKAAGATLIEKWDSRERPVSIYYIGDPENNILGFAPRRHNPRIKTP
jgi:predicted enzyme related to lactoylglutathione lyase